jgi:hypothetical protein
MPGAFAPTPAPTASVWRRFKIWFVGVGALLVGIGIGGATATEEASAGRVESLENDLAEAEQRAEEATERAAEAEEPPPAPAGPLEARVTESQGFTLVSLSLGEDFFSGDFEGTGRVIDTQGGRTATFIVTLFAGDAIVGTMSGILSLAPQGQELTVEFISVDSFVGGVTAYEFQTNSTD